MGEVKKKNDIKCVTIKLKLEPYGGTYKWFLFKKWTHGSKVN